MLAKPPFRDFIRQQLSRSNLSTKTLDRFTTPGNMTLFEQAITHKSISSRNYELFELKGDLYLNYCIAKYIQNKHPKVKSLGWLSKLKHYLQSVAALPRIARNIGIQKHLQIRGDFTPQQRENILDDVIESFFGVIVHISGEHQGAAFAVCYGILASMLDELNIKLHYQDFFDTKTRLKEIFDSQKWGHLRFRSFRNDGLVSVTVYRDPQIEVARGGYKPTEEEAERDAISKALIIHADKEKIPSPFVYTPKAGEILAPTLDKPMPVLPNLESWFIQILDYANIASPKDFTTKRCLDMVQQSLVSERYASTHNNYLYKFNGDTLGDLLVTSYVAQHTKVTDVGLLTKMRHSIVKTHPFALFWDTFGFEKVAYAGQRNTENTDLAEPTRLDMDWVVRAFLECLVQVIDQEKIFGVGFGIVLNMMFSFFQEVGLKTDTSVIYDPITELSVLFKRKDWYFSTKKNIDHIYDIEKKEHLAILKDGNGEEIARATGKDKREAKYAVAEKGIKILSGKQVEKPQITQKVVTIKTEPLHAKPISDRDNTLVELYQILLATSPLDIKAFAKFPKSEMLALDVGARTFASKRFKELTGRNVSVYGEGGKFWIKLI